MRKATLLLTVLLLGNMALHAQQVTDLFEKRTALSRNFSTVASKYEALELKAERFSSLQRNRPESFELKLPFENRELKLKLKQVKLTTDNFSVMEADASGKRAVQFDNTGVFYQGTLEDGTGFATISVINDRVMGVIADQQSNIVLGPIEANGKATSEYTLYRETDLKVKNPLVCATPDADIYADVHSSAANTPQPRGQLVGEPVEIYFECDYKFYQDKGSNTVDVINYVLGFFNNVALLYASEDIKVQVSQVTVWTSQDPEAAAGLNTTSTVLPAFRDRMANTNYVGDYAHFLSTRNLGGGIAYVLGSPCNTEKRYRTAVSAIYNTYSNFPTYSWTVEVVTHELGHNFGSNHTQWCGWVGGALDNCYPTEPYPAGTAACPPGPAPSNGGTIMSYCHLTGYGINFNNGFGTQPGNRIREVIGGAACFGSCRMTVDISKVDASCNQSNGYATVTTQNSTGALSYLWSNGQTTATLSNAAPGTYHVVVSDAAGCKITKDVVIGNSGTTLTFAVNPSPIAAICAGGNITLNATSNPGYTYQWYLGSNPIGGATSSSYNATAAGNYSVRAVSGSCNGTQNVQVVQVTPPTATITPAGSTTFCTGSSLILDATAGSGYTYQWYKNNDVISGATSATYTAISSGAYTVRVAAGATCQSTSSAVNITVNPSPSATLTTTGSLNFCSGSSVKFDASTGTGYSYQWYQDGDPILNATQSTYSATTSGTYNVQVTLGSCNASSEFKTVTVLPRPAVAVTPASSTIEKFQTQTLTATGASQYNWSSLPDMVSSTATTGTYRPLSTTTYTVEGTASNGCRNTATAVITVIGCGDVTNFSATAYSPSRVLLKWTNPAGVTTDTLQYRIAGTTVWTRLFVTGEQYELTGLQPGASYEYNLIPICTTSTVYVPSANQSIQTSSLVNGRYVRLFPNPVSSEARLEIITSSATSLSIVIYDDAGKLVRQILNRQNMPAGQLIQTIDASRLSNGLYLVSVTIDGKSEIIKMVVAH